MSGAVVRRRLVAVALMVAGLAACGGNHDGAVGVKGADGQSREPGVHVLSQRELDRAVVDAHDLPGIRVDKMGNGSDGVGEGVVHRALGANTHPDACAPVSAAVEGVGGYSPVASVQRAADVMGHSAILTLVSYRAADASRVVDELRTALRKCKAYQAGPMKATYKYVKATDDVPKGEEGVAFRLSLIVDPSDERLSIPVSVIVTRHGPVVATYKAHSDDAHTEATFPSGLVDAQTKALNAAVGGGR